MEYGTAEEAWVAVSTAAADAGWIDDWLADENAVPTWVEYLCERIKRTTAVDKFIRNNVSSL